VAYFDFEPEERYRSTWTPVIDVSENPSEIVVRVELPGVGRDSIRLTWKNDVLTISGVKERHPAEQDPLNYICLERQYGRFRRDITIRSSVDYSRAKADLADGLLRIRLPKATEPGGETVIPIK